MGSSGRRTALGELTHDIERCLRECACDAERARLARCSCEGGRVRETKRALLDERQRLVEAMHVTQRGIDSIDHLLHRVSTEM